MSLEQRLDQDIKEALKAGQKDKLTVLRGLKSALKYAQIDKGDDLTDQDVIAALSAQAKKVRDSIEQFEKGQRSDLTDQARAELKIIEEYLPEQLDEGKLREIIKEAIDELGAESAGDVGKVMQTVIPRVKGRADGKQVNKLAMEMLAK
jgi:hypothetical protein